MGNPRRSCDGYCTGMGMGMALPTRAHTHTHGTGFHTHTHGMGFHTHLSLPSSTRDNNNSTSSTPRPHPPWHVTTTITTTMITTTTTRRQHLTHPLSSPTRTSPSSPHMRRQWCDDDDSTSPKPRPHPSGLHPRVTTTTMRWWQCLAYASSSSSSPSSFICDDHDAMMTHNNDHRRTHPDDDDVPLPPSPSSSPTLWRWHGNAPWQRDNDYVLSTCPHPLPCPDNNDNTPPLPPSPLATCPNNATTTMCPCRLPPSPSLHLPHPDDDDDDNDDDAHALSSHLRRWLVTRTDDDAYAYTLSSHLRRWLAMHPNDMTSTMTTCPRCPPSSLCLPHPDDDNDGYGYASSSHTSGDNCDNDADIMTPSMTPSCIPSLPWEGTEAMVQCTPSCALCHCLCSPHLGPPSLPIPHRYTRRGYGYGYQTWYLWPNPYPQCGYRPVMGTGTGQSPIPGGIPMVNPRSSTHGWRKIEEKHTKGSKKVWGASCPGQVYGESLVSPWGISGKSEWVVGKHRRCGRLVDIGMEHQCSEDEGSRSVRVVMRSEGKW